MVPIILKQTGVPKEYESLEEFEHDFLLICQAHRNKGRALAFAFILYDLNHPQIRKVLDDPVYWDALDRISGNYLTIFSFHIAPNGRSSTGLKTQQRHKKTHSFTYSNHFIEKHFGINLPQSQPLLLFFQVDDGKFSKPYVYELNENSIENTFKELKTTFLTAVESVKNVEPRYHGKAHEIFSLIKNELGQRKILRAATTVTRAVKNIKEFIP